MFGAVHQAATSIVRDPTETMSFPLGTTLGIE